ncbi:MAG: hypothetical protein ACRDYE_13805, partial [Acidimicrobiales bacterium]
GRDPRRAPVGRRRRRPMKLTYRDLPAATPGRPAVVLHDRGTASVDRLVTLAGASGAVGRVVAPFGDYGFTAGGMELAGICWYRTVPGCAGADPISLARAVVQVGDLLDDLDLDSPALIGWGQGAVVALGTGFLHHGRVASVVCVDATPAHVEALPASVLAAPTPPTVLLVSSGRDRAVTDEAVAGPDVIDRDAATTGVEARLRAHGIDTTKWRGPDETGEDQDKAMAERIGRWLDDG